MVKSQAVWLDLPHLEAGILTAKLLRKKQLRNGRCYRHIKKKLDTRKTRLQSTHQKTEFAGPVAMPASGEPRKPSEWD